MIDITDNISINENELQFDFILSSGPGGQNVNKVATTVQLRFDVLQSTSLPEDVRERLIKLAGRRVTGEGILIIQARRFRSQQQNREDAINRFIELIRKAAIKPKRRIPTKPSFAAKQRRIVEKRKRSKIKQERRFEPSAED